jgi:splicing factor U2AF subunit
MITSEDLRDESEYRDICDDVREECSRYGDVRSVIIPRVQDGYPPSSEGSVYVEFLSKDIAQQAGIALSGRKFAERKVNVEYVSCPTISFYSSTNQIITV